MCKKLWCLLGIHELDREETKLLKITDVYFNSNSNTYSHSEYVYVSDCIICGKKIKTKVTTK